MIRCLWCDELFEPEKPGQVYCKPSHRSWAASLRKAIRNDTPDRVSWIEENREYVRSCVHRRELRTML